MNYEEIYNQAYGDTLEKVAMVGRKKLNNHIIENFLSGPLKGELSRSRSGRIQDYMHILRRGKRNAAVAAGRSKAVLDAYPTYREELVSVLKSAEKKSQRERLPSILKPVEKTSRVAANNMKSRAKDLQDIYDAFRAARE